MDADPCRLEFIPTTRVRSAAPQGEQDFNYGAIPVSFTC